MTFPRSISMVFCACLFVAAGTTLAAVHPVDCTAALTGIQAAVNVAAAGDQIEVTGMCQEHVVITGKKHLLIKAAAGGGGISVSDANAAAMINIVDSFNIKLWNMVLDGGGYAGGVGVNGSQQIELQGLTIQNGDSGILCDHQSYCKINQMGGTTSITHMTRFGISASANSVVDAGGSGSTLHIEDTGGGILVGGGSRLYLTGTWSIQNLKASTDGINVFGSEIGYRGGPGGGTIEGARIGINVSDNGSFTYGLSLNVEGNQQGVLVRNSSVAHLNNLTVNNNSGGTAQQSYGGVAVLDGSVATLTGATITANQAAGVYARNNATVTLISSTVTGNYGEGVLVTQRASVWLMQNAPASTISGNAGRDLVCTVQGAAFGDNSGVGKTHCKDFEKIP